MVVPCIRVTKKREAPVLRNNVKSGKYPNSTKGFYLFSLLYWKIQETTK
jgi:hypothetical protein